MLENIVNPKVFKRDSNFELLRIVSMIMVLSRHLLFFVAKKPSKNDPQISSRLALDCITSLADHGFMLITGYFGFTSDLRLSRFIPLLLEQEFYYLFYYFKGLYTGKIVFNKAKFYRHLFPILHRDIWFTGPYIVSQIIFSPIAKGIKTMGRKYLLLLIILIFGISVAACAGFSQSLLAPWKDGTNALPFLMFYSFGLYIRLYKVKIGSLPAIIGIIVLETLEFLGRRGYLTPFFPDKSLILKVISNSNWYSPTSTLSGVLLFFVFMNLRVPSFLKIPINIIAEHVFAAYIITEVNVSGYFQMYRSEIRSAPSTANACVYYSIILVAKCVCIDIFRSFFFNILILNRKYFKKICIFVDSLTSPDESYDDNEEVEILKDSKDKIFEEVKYEEESLGEYDEEENADA